MKIHLIETDEKPTIGTVVKAGCGEEIIFKTPIRIIFSEEGRLCEKCYNNHTTTTLKAKTFAHPKLEEGE